jgi:hypothetical protein
VEVRLELATPRETWLTPQASEEQTARVLQHTLPDPKALESPLSPLPMSKAPAAPAPSPVVSADALLTNALMTVDGFVLLDASHGVRIVFPRGW